MESDFRFAVEHQVQASAKVSLHFDLLIHCYCCKRNIQIIIDFSSNTPLFCDTWQGSSAWSSRAAAAAFTIGMRPYSSWPTVGGTEGHFFAVLACAPILLWGFSIFSLSGILGLEFRIPGGECSIYRPIWPRTKDTWRECMGTRKTEKLGDRLALVWSSLLQSIFLPAVSMKSPPWISYLLFCLHLRILHSPSCGNLPLRWSCRKPSDTFVFSSPTAASLGEPTAKKGQKTGWFQESKRLYRIDKCGSL